MLVKNISYWLSTLVKTIEYRNPFSGIYLFINYTHTLIFIYTHMPQNGNIKGIDEHRGTWVA